MNNKHESLTCTHSTLEIIDLQNKTPREFRSKLSEEFITCVLNYPCPPKFSTYINGTSFCGSLAVLYNCSSLHFSQGTSCAGFTSYLFHLCALTCILPISSLLWTSSFKACLLFITKCISLKILLHSLTFVFTSFSFHPYCIITYLPSPSHLI